MDGFANHVPQHTWPEVVGPVVLDFLGRHAGVAPEAGAYVGCATGRIVESRGAALTPTRRHRR